MKTNEKTTPVLAEKDRNTVSLELMNRMKLHGMGDICDYISGMTDSYAIIEYNKICKSL